MVVDGQVVFLCTDRAAELLVVTLVKTAERRKRWEKNDESRDGEVEE